ncbi:MAG: cytochrome c peroxidase [Pseudomonadota bacterium]
MNRCHALGALAALALLAVGPAASANDAAEAPWSVAERSLLASLSLLPSPSLPVPPSPSNALADSPAAAALGERLFFDTRLSANGEVSCANCHQPTHAFADSTARSRGLSLTGRNAPTVLGGAYQRWLYWDGRRDSLWAQALTPIEHPDEQGLGRVAVLAVLAEDPTYREAWVDLFDEAPLDVSDAERFPLHATPRADAPALAAWQQMASDDRARVDAAFARVGKAIAAYERTLLPAPSRFDRFVAALLAGDVTGGGYLSDEEQAGLRLFIGDRAQCTQCHNGPMFSNGGFHNIGLIARTATADTADLGRAAAVREVREDPFNCLGPHSDAAPADCAELRFMKARGADLLGAFRVPTLRNVARTAPYMHDGRFADLAAVLAHYVAAPTQVLGHQELDPLRLDAEELAALIAFLHALSGESLDDGVAALTP